MLSAVIAVSGEVMVNKTEDDVWGLVVHGVLAPVAFKERSHAVKAIKDWQSRGWEFVSVVNLEDE